MEAKTRSFDLPTIGRLPVNPAARRVFWASRLLAKPFYFLGSIALGVTIWDSLRNRSGSAEHNLTFVLVGSGFTGLLLGCGALSQFLGLKITAGSFKSGDWGIIMFRAMAANNAELTQKAATALTGITPQSPQETLLLGKAHLILSDSVDRRGNAAKGLDLYARVLSADPANTDARLDSAYLLHNLERYSEAVLICDDVIASSKNVGLRPYALKSMSQESMGSFDEANQTQDEIEAKARDWPNPDSIIQEARQRKVDLEKRKSEAFDAASVSSLLQNPRATLAAYMGMDNGSAELEKAIEGAEKSAQVVQAVSSVADAPQTREFLRPILSRLVQRTFTKALVASIIFAIGLPILTSLYARMYTDELTKESLNGWDPAVTLFFGSLFGLMVVGCLVGFYLDAVKLQKSSATFPNLDPPIKWLKLATILIVAISILLGIVFGAAPFSRAKAHTAIEGGVKRSVLGPS